MNKPQTEAADNTNHAGHMDGIYLIDVKKTLNGKEKSSIVDVREVNWELAQGVWKNDAGWEPADEAAIKSIEEWIKKSATPIKETPLDHFKTDTWKEVVKEQKKTEESQLGSKTNSVVEDKNTNKKGYTIPQEEKKKPGALFYFSLLVTVAFTIAGLYLLVTTNRNPPNSPNTTQNSLNNSLIFKPTESPSDNKGNIKKSEKTYFMRYIIEESIWRAKIRATLFNRAQGNTKLSDLKNYVNINATATEVIDIVNKMFDKANISSKNLSIEQLKPELLELEKALSIDEDSGKKVLCKLADKIDISLGTYPSKRVAERALRDKWISPLGKLHEATTGDSHKGRYPTDLDDPRSVGMPVAWQE